MTKLIFPDTDFNNLDAIIKTKKDLEKQIEQYLTETDFYKFIQQNENTMKAGLATSVLLEHLEQQGVCTAKLENCLKEIKYEKFGFLGYEGQTLFELNRSQGHFANVNNAICFSQNAGKNILVQCGEASGFNGNSGENAIFKDVKGEYFFDNSLNNAQILDNSDFKNFFENSGKVLIVKNSTIKHLIDNSGENITLDNSLLMDLRDNSAKNVIAKNGSRIRKSTHESLERIKLYDSNFADGEGNSAKDVFLDNSKFQLVFDSCGKKIKARNGSKICDLYDFAGKEIYLLPGVTPSHVIPNGKQKIFTINKNFTSEEVEDYEIGESFYF